jgi:hypothetical protein
MRFGAAGSDFSCPRTTPKNRESEITPIKRTAAVPAHCSLMGESSTTRDTITKSSHQQKQLGQWHRHSCLCIDQEALNPEDQSNFGRQNRKEKN